MSRAEVLKAELKARRSSRELEHGFDHLAERLEESVERAQQVRARASELAERVRHPGETVSGFVSDRARGLNVAIKSRMQRTPQGAGTAIVGLLSVATAVGTFLFLRNRRRAEMVLVTSERPVAEAGPATEAALHARRGEADFPEIYPEAS